MPKNAEEKLLQKVTAILEELDIPYGTTGGFAIIVWGKPHGMVMERDWWRQGLFKIIS